MKHFFYKGKENQFDFIEDFSIENGIKVVKKEFAKVLESRNLSFLLGSGCSLGTGGIPTMKELAEDFYSPSTDSLAKMSVGLKNLVLSEANKSTLKELKIDYTTKPFSVDVEAFLGTLYSLKFYYDQISDFVNSKKVSDVIKQTKHFILYRCLNHDNEGKDLDVKSNYQSFYRKLSLRDSNLPKPNIFTTNYDLYSEKAMDELGIAYTNGFSGFIQRYFNPAIFNYALAEQMDISSFKWNVIDSYIYLFKIHGSVNWIEEEDGKKLFRIKELQNISFEHLKKAENIMIYPSPIKQNASLGTPYSDLFREFQRRITQNQSILVTIGYSFGDEHINNLIYQALTIPTFRLVIFSEIGYYHGEQFINVKKSIERLKDLNDPRIWIIGSDREYTGTLDHEEINPEKALFYYSTITNELLPDWSENRIEDQNQKIAEIINAKEKD